MTSMMWDGGLWWDLCLGTSVLTWEIDGIGIVDSTHNVSIATTSWTLHYSNVVRCTQYAERYPVSWWAGALWAVLWGR